MFTINEYTKFIINEVVLSGICCISFSSILCSRQTEASPVHCWLKEKENATVLLTADNINKQTKQFFSLVSCCRHKERSANVLFLFSFFFSFFFFSLSCLFYCLFLQQPTTTKTTKVYYLIRRVF